MQPILDQDIDRSSLCIISRPTLEHKKQINTYTSDRQPKVGQLYSITGGHTVQMSSGAERNIDIVIHPESKKQGPTNSIISLSNISL